MVDQIKKKKKQAADDKLERELATCRSLEMVDIEQIDEFMDNNSSDLENGLQGNSDEEEEKEGQTAIDKEIQRVNTKMRIKTGGNRSISFFKTLVSKKKRRYVQDGYDLDMSYITE